MSCTEESFVSIHEEESKRIGVVKRSLVAICNTAQLPFEPESVRILPRKASKLSKAEGGFLAQEISGTSGALASAVVAHSTVLM